MIPVCAKHIDYTANQMQGY